MLNKKLFNNQKAQKLPPSCKIILLKKDVWKIVSWIWTQIFIITFTESHWRYVSDFLQPFFQIVDSAAHQCNYDSSHLTCIYPVFLLLPVFHSPLSCNFICSVSGPPSSVQVWFPALGPSSPCSQHKLLRLSLHFLSALGFTCSDLRNS